MELHGETARGWSARGRCGERGPGVAFMGGDGETTLSCSQGRRMGAVACAERGREQVMGICHGGGEEKR